MWKISAEQYSIDRLKEIIKDKYISQKWWYISNIVRVAAHLHCYSMYSHITLLLYLDVHLTESYHYYDTLYHSHLHSGLMSSAVIATRAAQRIITPIAGNLLTLYLPCGARDKDTRQQEYVSSTD